MEKLRDGLAREVIFGGAKPSRRNDERHAIQRVAKCLTQQIAVVANNRFSYHLDTNLVQLFRQEERIGVEPVRRKQFRTNCNDLCFQLTAASLFPGVFSIPLPLWRNLQTFWSLPPERPWQSFAGHVQGHETQLRDHLKNPGTCFPRLLREERACTTDGQYLLARSDKLRVPGRSDSEFPASCPRLHRHRWQMGLRCHNPRQLPRNESRAHSSPDQVSRTLHVMFRWAACSWLYPNSGSPRTSQSSVKSAPVVARIARPEDCSAMPTRPEPLRTTSACACGVMRTMPRRPP